MWDFVLEKNKRTMLANVLIYKDLSKNRYQYIGM